MVQVFHHTKWITDWYCASKRILQTINCLQGRTTILITNIIESVQMGYIHGWNWARLSSGYLPQRPCGVFHLAWSHLTNNRICVHVGGPPMALAIGRLSMTGCRQPQAECLCHSLGALTHVPVQFWTLLVPISIVEGTVAPLINIDRSAWVRWHLCTLPLVTLEVLCL